MRTIPGWRFNVVLSGDPRQGGALEIRIDAADAKESGDVLDSVFEAFEPVANTGGFGGRGPSNGGVRADAIRIQREPGANENELVWRVVNFGVDYRSLSVLLSAIEGTEEPLRRVIVRALAEGPEPAIQVGDCPHRRESLPFELSESREDLNVRVEVEFARRLEPDAMAHIQDVLEYWADLGVLGGFRRADAESAGESVLYPMEDVSIVVDAFSFSLPYTTASDCAFDCLVNVLATLSDTVARIERVTIE